MSHGGGTAPHARQGSRAVTGDEARDLTVRSRTGLGGVEPLVEPRPMGKCVRSAISGRPGDQPGAGRALGAAARPSHNPPVLGSIPSRPTKSDLRERVY